MEVFYTFRWGGNRGGENQRAQHRGKPGGKSSDKPRGKGPRRDGGRDGAKGSKAKSYKARPPKKEKAIDPDNPFAAALMGLKKDT